MLQNNWRLLIIVVCLIALFLQGGATREGLAFHIIFSGLSWLGIGVLLLAKGKDTIRTIPKTPIILFAIIGLWIGVTLIPFPAQFVGKTIIDQAIVSERSLLGLDVDFITISADPVESLRGLLAFGTPLLALSLVATMNEGQRRRLFHILLGVGAISVSLGLAQIFDGPDSFLYFWDITNENSPVGPYSNANHQTSFLAMMIPLMMYLVARYRHVLGVGDEGLGLGLIIVGGFSLFLVGLIAAGSLAGYGLAVFGFLASGILFHRNRSSSSASDVSGMRKAFVFVLPIVLVLTAVFSVVSSPRISGIGGLNVADGFVSRDGIFRQSAEIFWDNPVTGTGLGSFETVYRLYEDPDLVTHTFVNHAHSDWIEWCVELGLVGVITLLLFSIWLGRAFWGLFFAPRYSGQRIGQAAAIAIMIPILHALVDYPLRSPLYAFVFALLLCVAVTRPYEPPRPQSVSAAKEKKKVL